MSFERRDVTGGAVSAVLLGDITSTSTTFGIDNATGWPAGTNGKFFVTLDRGQANEERILVLSRSGTTLQLSSAADRGVDGTTAASHSAGAKVEHTLSGVDVDEANYTVAQTVGKVTTKGDTLACSATNALVRVPVGSNGTLYQADSAQAGGVKWASVSETNIATSVAGAGLSGGGGSPLAVNVDASTIEINADTLRVKDAGLTTAKYADASVTVAKLAQGTAEGTMAAPVVSSGTLTFAASELKHTALTDYTFTAVATRRYAVCVLADLEVNNANDLLNLKVRDGGGSTPTTSSTLLGQIIRRLLPIAGASGRETGYWQLPVSGLSAGTHTLNLFAVREAGSAGSDFVMSCQLWVEDIGT